VSPIPESSGWWLPLAVLGTSLVPALLIMLLAEHRQGVRTVLNLGAAVVKLALVAYMTWGVAFGNNYELRFGMMPGVDFVLRADAMSMLFAGLSAALWLFTTIYAIGYLEGAPNRSRFFGFFSLCVASTMGIALAGNLVTFLLFYELLTLSTYPLVVHRGTAKSLNAGRTYLRYTIGGGAVLLVGVALFTSLVGDVSFADTGALVSEASYDATLLRVAFWLLIAGLGVKAALVPLHGWLPIAMVAPAPVSALLHAVAVVKAGAFGIVRVVYNVYGVETAQALGVLFPLAVLASITIIWGSVRALFQTEIKKRLAYSTISQVSYIALGVALFGPWGSIGGLAHLLHQGLMKTTLFFCAGNYAETLGVHDIAELDGAGRRMPVTSAAFTIGAFGMIGVPPLAGFVSKWYLGLGALESGMPWVLGVLVLSSLLNAAYFLPIVHRLWFRPQTAPWPDEHSFGTGETNRWLLLPTVATAVFTVGAGVFANMPYSPLRWAMLVVARVYTP
jgi:multicomponent Na+:H+ antiporter subunit D